MLTKVTDVKSPLTGAVFVDRLTGERHEVTAKVVVNAAGAWADAVAARHTLNMSIMDLQKTQRNNVGH